MRTPISTNNTTYKHRHIYIHTHTCQFFYPNIKYQTLTFPNIGINFREKKRTYSRMISKGGGGGNSGERYIN
ncbi:hypothetical protein OrNV_gp049 [Oryctes rhinoceros nudivirus]|uniref:Uncharacterized protein n=1 Tax=Oryctes rhinoceros nudivirus TaxID=92521 RepID=B7SV70_9VIRU|nr:hypothetical protein OrNV_gp049 [Oryctes rhinoceros nudivirus]ACH96179.1 unknown [Oryctes rhinoceros nudivirus]